MFSWDIREIRWKDNYKEKCCAVWLLQRGWMQSGVRGLAPQCLQQTQPWLCPLVPPRCSTTRAPLWQGPPRPTQQPRSRSAGCPPGAVWVLIAFASAFVTSRSQLLLGVFHVPTRELCTNLLPAPVVFLIPTFPICSGPNAAPV